MKLALLLVLMIFLSACNNSAVKDTRSTGSVTDSQVSAIKDTTTSVKRNIHKVTSEENPGGDLISIFNEYVDHYKKPCIIDSVFTYGVDTFQLHLKHYCLIDNAIKVPKQYVSVYKLDSFVTHNFATIIRLDKNRKTIFKRTIYKNDFQKFLYPQLKEYGALLCPEIKLSNNAIELDYSISIPLTDVGVGVAMVINPDGTIIYKNH